MMALTTSTIFVILALWSSVFAIKPTYHDFGIARIVNVPMNEKVCVPFCVPIITNPKPVEQKDTPNIILNRLNVGLYTPVEKKSSEYSEYSEDNSDVRVYTKKQSSLVDNNMHLYTRDIIKNSTVNNPLVIERIAKLYRMKSEFNTLITLYDGVAYPENAMNLQTDIHETTKVWRMTTNENYTIPVLKHRKIKRGIVDFSFNYTVTEKRNYIAINHGNLTNGLIVVLVRNSSTYSKFDCIVPVGEYTVIQKNPNDFSFESTIIIVWNDRTQIPSVMEFTTDRSLFHNTFTYLLTLLVLFGCTFSFFGFISLTCYKFRVIQKIRFKLFGPKFHFVYDEESTELQVIDGDIGTVL